MPSQDMNNCFVSLNGQDISAYVQSVQLSWKAETDDDAAMGDNTAKVIATRQNWSVKLTAKQDFANSALDSILWTVASGMAAVAFAVRPDAGSVSTSNPSYSGNVVMISHDILSGSHGKLAKTSIDLAPAGDLSRATA